MRCGWRGVGVKKGVKWNGADRVSSAYAKGRDGGSGIWCVVRVRLFDGV